MTPLAVLLKAYFNDLLEEFSKFWVQKTSKNLGFVHGLASWVSNALSSWVSKAKDNNKQKQRRNNKQ